MRGKQLTTEELKERELKILKFFHNYCEENNLTYWLSAGSLIGAVRHKGFIPWDDDIDVGMPRKDYMRLIQIFPKEGIDGLKLLTPFNQKDCPITFGKLYDTKTVKMDDEVEEKYQKYGIDIDIFPWDYAPSTMEQINYFYKKQYYRFKVFLGIVGKYRKEKKLSKTVIKTFFMTGCKLLAKINIINANKIALKMNNAADQFDNGKYWCSSMQPLGRKAKGVATKESFDELLLVDFESEKFFIPKGYDEMLTNIYGDYMKFPPKEQQVTHHLSSVYERD